MRGTSCTNFTSWICIFSYSMTVWLSWTHTWHNANKNMFSFLVLSSITETTCFSLNDHSVVQLKMSGTFEVTQWSLTPLKARLHLCKPPAISLTLCLSVRLSLSLTTQGHDIQGYFNFLAAQASELNFWTLLLSSNTIRQLSFICALRPVSASVKVQLPDSHTVMNYIPLASKVVFWQMLQRLSRRGFILLLSLFF